MGGKKLMADDRMRNDDLDKHMGGQNQGDYGKGQQSPGRNKQDDDFSTGQRGAGQYGTEKQGEQKHMKDDFGTSEKSDVGQGGRNL
jgi:hypothetical protein